MTDIGSILPDTAAVPVADDLVHPQQQQNGHSPGHLQVAPVDDSVSSRRSTGTELTSNNLLNGKRRSDSNDVELGTANLKTAAPLSNSQPEGPAKAKAGVFNTMLEKPMQGPRNGIHWGAGEQSYVQSPMSWYDKVVIFFTPSQKSAGSTITCAQHECVK